MIRRGGGEPRLRRRPDWVNMITSAILEALEAVGYDRTFDALEHEHGGAVTAPRPVGELAGLAGRPLDDPRAEVLPVAVADRIRASEGQLDVILLDVDNGLHRAAFRTNVRLYAPAGLATAARARPGRRPGRLERLPRRPVPGPAARCRLRGEPERRSRARRRAPFRRWRTGRRRSSTRPTRPCPGGVPCRSRSGCSS